MYTIDADKITIRDVIALRKAGTDIEAQIPILRKCVIVENGGDIEDLPARHLALISKALVEKIAGDQTGN